jgi:hypothetical protein
MQVNQHDRIFRSKFMNLVNHTTVTWGILSKGSESTRGILY